MDYWLIETGETQPGYRRRAQPPPGGRRPRHHEHDRRRVARQRDGGRKRPPAGEIIGDRMPIPGVGWFAAFTDTEGNRFGLMQSDEAAG